MKTKEQRIFLATVNGADGNATERLLRAMKPSDAMREIVGVKVASPEDVARLVSAGVKVEDVPA